MLMSVGCATEPLPPCIDVLPSNMLPYLHPWVRAQEQDTYRSIYRQMRRRMYRVRGQTRRPRNMRRIRMRVFVHFRVSAHCSWSAIIGWVFEQSAWYSHIHTTRSPACEYTSTTCLRPARRHRRTCTTLSRQEDSDSVQVRTTSRAVSAVADAPQVRCKSGELCWHCAGSLPLWHCTASLPRLLGPITHSHLSVSRSLRAQTQFWST